MRRMTPLQAVYHVQNIRAAASVASPRVTPSCRKIDAMPSPDRPHRRND